MLSTASNPMPAHNSSRYSKAGGKCAYGKVGNVDELTETQLNVNHIGHHRSNSLDGHSQYIQDFIRDSFRMMSYDADKEKLQAEIEQHLETIHKLRTKLKELREENNEMFRKLNNGFQCNSFTSWFC